MVAKYFILGFSALLPLINPPGSALELLQIVGLGEEKPYKHLARKVAVNMVILLTVTAIAGPRVLQFFGISIEIALYRRTNCLEWTSHVIELRASLAWPKSSASMTEEAKNL